MTTNQNNTELFDHIRRRFPPELKRIIKAIFLFPFSKHYEKSSQKNYPKTIK